MPTPLSPESIVHPEAQQYVKVPVTIMRLIGGKRRLIWGTITNPDVDSIGPPINIEISQSDAELIEKISEGNVMKIEAILSSYS